MKRFRITCIVGLLALLVSFAPASAAPEAPPQTGPIGPAVVTNADLDPFSIGPTYDSGWHTIAKGQTIGLYHGLGLPPALMYVQLEQRKYNSEYGIHQAFAGGNDLGTKSSTFGAEDQTKGAYWKNLTTNSIAVTRQADDTLVDAVRVRIWKMSHEADYSSGWTTLTAGQSTIFTHDLGGDPFNYVVDLMFYDTNPSSESMGVNQRAFGGRTLGLDNTFFDDGQRVGAYWHALAGNVIYVYREPDDEWADQAMVRIWKNVKPTYDSNWISFQAGSILTLGFYINGNSDDYRVDMEFKDSTPPFLVNTCFYGGNDVGPKPTFPPALNNDRVGAYWYALDNNSIQVKRREEDMCAESVRIRIWNFWTPSAPEIDSGWLSVTPNQLGGITGLPANLDPYLVDLQFKAGPLAVYGIHQRGLGGMDWNFNGTISRVGGFWSANSNGIMFFVRREEDDLALNFRARLWKMPKPAYDSGWYTFPDGIYAQTFYHNLGGNAANYLVDVSFKDRYGSQTNYGYGGFDNNYLGPDVGDQLGAYWDGLDSSRIEVRRQPQENNNLTTHILKTRVRIWTLASPDYDSQLQGVLPGQALNLTHNLGGSPSNYLVNLVFNNTSASYKLHHMYYGGTVLGSKVTISPYQPGDQAGGFWRSLDSTSIHFNRLANDVGIDQARIRIWQVRHTVYLPRVKK